MAMDTIWVYAEIADGDVTPGTLELLTKARALAPDVAMVLGGDGERVAPVLGSYGAAKLFATGDLGEHLSGVAVAAAMAGVIGGGEAPDLIMFPTTYGARDVVARLSVKLDRTMLSDNIDVVVEGDTVSTITAIFGGNTLVTTRATGARPYLVTFRPKSFVAEDAGGPPAEVVSLVIPELGVTGAARVEARLVEESSGPKLDEAEVVVAGGRGLGGAGKYELIEQLARLLRGAPGASRAIVDAGWVPDSYQVGQTGKVVKPAVYMAAGISGATQHMVGMKGSKNIIAINKVLQVRA